jgi:hypothetical protein
MDDKLLLELPKNYRHLLSEYFDYNKDINIITIFEKNGVTTVTQESNGLISDGHYGKRGHQKIGELFYNHIKNNK